LESTGKEFVGKCKTASCVEELKNACEILHESLQQDLKLEAKEIEFSKNKSNAKLLYNRIIRLNVRESDRIIAKLALKY